MFKSEDSILQSAVNQLIQKYKCQAVILYGSRARGDSTDKSDYDLMGIRRSGKTIRYAKKMSGKYLDVFIFSSRELIKIGDEHLYMKDAKVLFQKNNVGTIFIRKLKAAVKKPIKPLPSDEIKARKVWAYKMLERIEVKDIEAKYRRSWLHEALLIDYFSLRRKRYWGSKESFQWLKRNDLRTFKLFDAVLNSPEDLKLLKKLVDRVVRS